MNEDTTYQSFLLRIWRGGSPETPRWRASLEDTGSGERYAFTSVEQLYLFLERAGMIADNPKDERSL